MMTEGFRVAGKKMTDSALLPWALASAGRSFLFYAEAQPASNRRVLSAIAAYYSLFHLSMFLAFVCPKFFSEPLRKKIAEELAKDNDPSKKVKHKELLDFLRGCIAYGLPGSVVDAVQHAQKLRNFINYGPRVSWSGETFHLNTCEASFRELEQLREQLDQVFREAMVWACDNGIDDGIWVPVILDEANIFFSKSNRHYGDWCTDAEAALADSFRASMFAIAQQKVYPEPHSPTGAH